MDIEETVKGVAAQRAADEEAEKNIPKSDKPVVDLYVMSFCPYGNKAEDTLKPVYELLKDKVDFNFRYIVSSEGDKINSLHGQPEVDQNEREVCVMKDYGKDVWMNFVTYVNVNCGSDGTCWEEGAKGLGLSIAKINYCVTSEGAALMKVDEKASTEAGASGSPTMIINGASTKAVYQYGNSESYKQAICNAFNESPAECAEELSGSTSTAEGGSCE
jgi:glutaredoxin